MTEYIDADVLIIGGGPAGCSCALYTSRSSLKTYVLDKNPSVGALAITHKIANYPGVSNEVSGSDLLEMMRNQAISYGHHLCCVLRCLALICLASINLFIPQRVFFRSKTIVLATGAMGRTSTLEGEKEFLGRGVSYCATCDAAFYRNEEVLVYGSNQEAVDEALVLAKFAKTVHWVTSGKPSRSTNRVDVLLNLPNVEQSERTKLLSIHGDDDGLKYVNLQSVKDNNAYSLDVSGVFSVLYRYLSQ
jgi:thioredoxin reductase (NADPH)